MRRLPAWSPLVLAAVALLAIPLLFQVPRESEAADTALEAFPFLLAGAALLLVPFTAPGRLRTLGLVVALLLATAPVWWSFVYGVAEEARLEDSTATLRVLVVPEDESAAYDILLPLPLSPEGAVPAVLDPLPSYERNVSVTMHDGVPMLRVQGQGVLERAYFHDYGSRSEAWLQHAWPWDVRPTFGPSTTGTALTVVLEYEGSSAWCGGRAVLTGALGTDGSGYLHAIPSFACA